MIWTMRGGSKKMSILIVQYQKNLMLYIRIKKAKIRWDELIRRYK
jgi:hypothetical protein